MRFCCFDAPNSQRSNFRTRQSNQCGFCIYLLDNSFISIVNRSIYGYQRLVKKCSHVYLQVLSPRDRIKHCNLIHLISQGSRLSLGNMAWCGLMYSSLVWWGQVWSGLPSLVLVLVPFWSGSVLVWSGLVWSGLEVNQSDLDLDYVSWVH